MDPDLFAVFCEEYTTELNRLRRAAGDQRATRAREFAKIDQDIERLVQALIDGVPAEAVKAKMESLEAKKVEIAAGLTVAPDPKPIVHPAMAEIYRSRVENLSDALGAPDTRGEAAESLRGLVEQITHTPETEGYAILLKGDLAGILALAAEAENSKTAAACGPTAVSQVSLVAGAGFDLHRTSQRLVR